MSLKRVLETLVSYGLKPSDVKIYIFLAKKGPHNGRELCNILTMPKHQIYQCLRNLQAKGIITATPERPALFFAVPFEKVLEILVKTKLQEAERTQQEKAEALSKWQTLTDENLKLTYNDVE